MPITIAVLQHCIDIASLPDRLDVLEDDVETEILQIARQLQLLTETALQEVSSALDGDMMADIASQTDCALLRRTRWTREMVAACTVAVAHYLQHMYSYRWHVLLVLYLAVSSVILFKCWMEIHTSIVVSRSACNELPWIATNRTCTDAYCVLGHQAESLGNQLLGRTNFWNTMSTFDRQVLHQVHLCRNQVPYNRSRSIGQRLEMCQSEFVQKQQQEFLRSNQSVVVVTVGTRLRSA